MRGLPWRDLNFLAVVLVLIVTSSWWTTSVECYIIGDDAYHRAEYLDSQEKYYLEWQVDQVNKQISFTVIAETTGYIIFGLGNNASAGGADIVIAGVRSNGRPYISDRSTLGQAEIFLEDTTRNYVLQDGWENATHTGVRFFRSFDTCDILDYPITENKITVIWGFGVNDKYKKESVKLVGVKGFSDVHLLDPEYSPRVVRDQVYNNYGATAAPVAIVANEKLQVWTIRRNIVIPENHTTYLCSIHRAPRLDRKHHMVGFEVFFPREESRRYVHHMLVYKCNAPGLGDPRPYFESFEGGIGQSCYISQRPATGGRPIPQHLCNELWMGWAIGGRPFFTPPHVGFPLGQDTEEYYLVQLHYDNPERRSQLSVDIELNFFYTSSLRHFDGGMMGIGAENPSLPVSSLLPPQTPRQRVFTHCPGECTTRMFPRSGIKIFAAHLHTHISGKSARLRHFSGNVERPWVLHDDNYDNNFQQSRHLKEEVHVLPGDQLTTECIYDNTWTNGSIVSGFSTRQEMCFTFLFYYNRVRDYSYCISQIVSQEYRRQFLGVDNVTWVEDQLEWVATTPPNLAGLTMTQVSDNYVTWDQGRRQRLMRFHEAHPQVSRCPRAVSFRSPAELQQLLSSGALELSATPVTSVNTANDYVGRGEYPFNARAYVPEKSCSYRG